jgi:hypothetical protein
LYWQGNFMYLFSFILLDSVPTLLPHHTAPVSAPEM